MSEHSDAESYPTKNKILIYILLFKTKCGHRKHYVYERDHGKQTFRTTVLKNTESGLPCE